MPEKHSRAVPGGRAVWYTERLWALSAGLPVEDVAIADVAELDADCWFGADRVPSVRAVAEHAARIAAADLSHPIILSADGRLMDGGHRLAKAWLAGATHVRAVRFREDPAPDYFVRDPADPPVEADVLDR
jgi:hypothetical protein